MWDLRLRMSSLLYAHQKRHDSNVSGFVLALGFAPCVGP